MASQQATVVQVQAAVTQSEASVNQSQVNRQHTIIVAPIDGIVTQRSVDVGQTVAASMSAPTLFVIAADLTEMQVNANIDEADVGRIRPGQHVTFRVDAYPTDNFIGTVTQIRLQPVVVQNVTTYGTVITVPNRELKLKPGMTANVKIEIAKRTNALRIPNAALRFRPTAEVFAALQADAAARDERVRRRRAWRPRRRRRRRAPAQPRRQPSPQRRRRASRPQRRAAPPPLAHRRAQRTPRRRRRRRGGGRGGGGGGGGGGRRRPRVAGAHARTLQDDVARGAAAVPRAHEGTRRRHVSAFEAAHRPPAKTRRDRGRAAQAQTIDALFAPLPSVESRGRAWLLSTTS